MSFGAEQFRPDDLFASWCKLPLLKNKIPSVFKKKKKTIWQIALGRTVIFWAAQDLQIPSRFMSRDSIFSQPFFSENKPQKTRRWLFKKNLFCQDNLQLITINIMRLENAIQLIIPSAPSSRRAMRACALNEVYDSGAEIQGCKCHFSRKFLHRVTAPNDVERNL